MTIEGIEKRSIETHDRILILKKILSEFSNLAWKM